MTESVTINFALADSSPKRGDFGVIALFASCPYPNEPLTFTADAVGKAAMLDEGFTVNDEAYHVLSAMGAQDGGQDSLKIYPRDAGANAQEYTLTPNKLTVGTRYTLGVKGPGGAIDAEYTVESGDTAADICTGLMTALVAQTPAQVSVIGNSDGEYTVRIDRTDYSTTAASDTIDEIGTALAAVINADDDLIATYDEGTDKISITNRSGAAVTITSVTSPSADLSIAQQGAGPDVGTYVAADDTGSVLTLTPVIAGERFHLDEWCNWLDVQDTSSDAGIATDLAAGLAADPEFYGLLIDSTCPAELEAARVFAAANDLMFCGMSVDSDMGSSADDDIGSDFSAAASRRGKIFYHKKTQERVDACMLGKVFGHRATYGWEHVRPQSCSAPNMRAGFRANLDSKEVGYLLNDRGETFAKNTKFPGRYPDLTRGFDWWLDRVEAAMLKCFLDGAENGGIAFTDDGLKAFRAMIEAEATVGINGGLLASDPAPTVSLVVAADVSPADKAARHYSGVSVAAVIQGKVETLEVNIVATV